MHNDEFEKEWRRVGILNTIGAILGTVLILLFIVILVILVLFLGRTLL